MAGNAIGAAKRVAALAGIPPAEFVERIASGEKFCWRCRVLHPRSAFNTDATRDDGLDPACRDSRSKNSKERYQRRPRVSKLGAFFAETRDGDQKQARARVNHRVNIGLIPDPNDIPCTDCGHAYADGERRHEYDHHLGYAAEHQLSVQAVCTTCHHTRERDRRG